MMNGCGVLARDVVAAGVSILLLSCTSEAPPPAANRPAETTAPSPSAGGWIALDGSPAATERLGREVASALDGVPELADPERRKACTRAVLACLQLYGTAPQGTAGDQLSSAGVEFLPATQDRKELVTEWRTTPDRSWRSVRSGSLAIRSVGLSADSPLMNEARQIARTAGLPEDTRVLLVRQVVQSTFGPEFEMSWCLFLPDGARIIHPLAWESKDDSIVMAYRLEE